MRKQKGFTLIELLVVIAIIGVMAALVIVNLSSANRKSRDSRRKADLAEIKTALELYYDDHLAYPSDIYAASDSLEPTYIKTVPTDPRGANYTYTTDNSEFTISADLEAPRDGEANPYSVFSSN